MTRENTLLGIAMQSRFGVLFLALVLVMFVPFLVPGILGKFLVPLLFTLVMLAALATVADTRRQFVIGLALAIPAFSLTWLDELAGGTLAAWHHAFSLLFFLYLAGAILTYVLHAHEVDVSTIFAAVSVYFLLAYIWATGYALLELANPGSITITALGTETGFDRIQNSGYLTYFSFVTLTTLGYGDVTPASDGARVLAVTEAALGQLFLVVLVARLVGLHTSLDYATHQAAKAKRLEESGSS